MEIIKYNNLDNFNEKEPIYIKILVVGTIFVGKTFFMNRIQYYNKGEVINLQNINKDYIPTIGRDFGIFHYKNENKLFTVQIWVISGQKRWKDTVYYLSRGAGVIILFYNSFNRISFNKAIEFDTNLYKSDSKPIYALIKAKYDLPLTEENNNDIVCDEEALEFTDKNDIIFAHLSSFEKYEAGVNELFREIFLKYQKKFKI